MLIATLAIAGIPGFAGFFSKDEILWQAWLWPNDAYHVLWFLGWVTAFMTAFYMFRLVYLTFWSPSRLSQEAEHHVHESPGSMTVPLLVLAFCSIFAGYLGLPHALGGSNRFEHFLEPVFAGNAAQVVHTEGPAALEAASEAAASLNPLEYLLMFLSVGVALVGWYLARRAYSNAGEGYAEPIAQASPPLYNTLLHKYYVDEAYDYVFTGRRPLGGVRLGAMGLGEALWKFDSEIIDGGVNGAGWITRAWGTASSWWDKWIIDGVLVNGPALLTRGLSFPGAHCAVGAGAVVRAGDGGGLGGFCFLLPVEVSRAPERWRAGLASPRADSQELKNAEPYSDHHFIYAPAGRAGALVHSQREQEHHSLGGELVCLGRICRIPSADPLVLAAAVRAGV